MRRLLGRALIVAGALTLVGTTLGAPASFAAEIRTFADDFSNKSYSASDGTHHWNGPWQEAPAHNGSNKGNISIENSGSGCSGCLTIGRPIEVVDGSISRSVDLEGATEARLDLRYRTVGDPAETAIVRLSVHDGSSSRTLWTFSLAEQDVAMLSASFDIGSHTGPETTIRFAIVGAGATDAELRIAEVTITATIGPDDTTTTTPTTTTTTTVATTVPESTTTTRPPTTTTRPTTTTTTTAGPNDTAPTTTTTVIVPPTEDPDYATDKVVLVSDNEGAAMAVMQPMDVMMLPENRPDSVQNVTFVNAAESVRSTAVYGVGIGVLLAGFLLLGFDDGDPKDRRRRD